MVEMRFCGEKYFDGNPYEGMEDRFTVLQGALEIISDDKAFRIFGKGALRATDIEITPPTSLEDFSFRVNAWHETGGSAPGILYPREFAFRLYIPNNKGVIKGVGGIITEIGGENSLIPLTLDDVGLLTLIGKVSVHNSMLSPWEDPLAPDEFLYNLAMIARSN